MRIRHAILAFWLDEAVGWFGQFVENKLAERDPHTHKAVYGLEGLLGITPEKPKPKDVPEGVYNGVRVRRE